MIILHVPRDRPFLGLLNIERGEGGWGEQRDLRKKKKEEKLRKNEIIEKKKRQRKRERKRKLNLHEQLYLIIG